MSTARLFILQRDRDVTGVSGPGPVADGVQWPDGSVAMRWRERPSTSVWESLDLMLSVHGHHGATRVVWADDQPAPVDRAAAYREVADRLATDAQQGNKEGFTRIYRRSAATQVRQWADEFAPEHAAPATTCNAQYDGRSEEWDAMRLCIRAGHHVGRDHVDEHGFHWSDTVAVYPVCDVGANDTQACPYCTGAPQFPRRDLGVHVETTHARVLAALARGVSLDELLHNAAVPHEMEG